MHRSETFQEARTAAQRHHELRGSGQLLPMDEPTFRSAERHLRASRDYEASRLLLAALGRRHGPCD
jgi:hypothetical protein